RHKTISSGSPEQLLVRREVVQVVHPNNPVVISSSVIPEHRPGGCDVTQVVAIESDHQVEEPGGFTRLRSRLNTQDWEQTSVIRDLRFNKQAAHHALNTDETSGNWKSSTLRNTSTAACRSC